MRILLRYSAAFGATTAFTALVLFGLRSVYREDFGTDQLGYWLVANRISDMSTQLLGLFMVQLFVPYLAMAEGEKEQRALVLRSWAAGAAAMTGVLAVFTLAAEPLVHLLLSDVYLPAIPAIRIYMIGDVLRVWASLAMFSAFARGRPARYAAIEIGTYALMAVLTLALLWAGRTLAPELGYAGAFGLVAIVVTIAFLRKTPR